VAAGPVQVAEDDGLAKLIRTVETLAKDEFRN
jgi:hypothetical protein